MADPHIDPQKAHEAYEKAAEATKASREGSYSYLGKVQEYVKQEISNVDPNVPLENINPKGWDVLMDKLEELRQRKVELEAAVQEQIEKDSQKQCGDPDTVAEGKNGMKFCTVCEQPAELCHG